MSVDSVIPELQNFTSNIHVKNVIMVDLVGVRDLKQDDVRNLNISEVFPCAVILVLPATIDPFELDGFVFDGPLILGRRQNVYFRSTGTQASGLGVPSRIELLME